MILFDPHLVYPRDSTGPYIDLDGIIIESKRVDLTGDIQGWAIIHTSKGDFEGYARRQPKVGYHARIHVYDSGGGWYPDNLFLSYSIEERAT